MMDDLVEAVDVSAGEDVLPTALSSSSSSSPPPPPLCPELIDPARSGGREADAVFLVIGSTCDALLCMEDDECDDSRTGGRVVDQEDEVEDEGPEAVPPPPELDEDDDGVRRE